MIRTRIAIIVLLLLHAAGCLPPSAPPAKQVLTEQKAVGLVGGDGIVWIYERTIGDNGTSNQCRRKHTSSTL